MKVLFSAVVICDMYYVSMRRRVIPLAGQPREKDVSCGRQ